MVSTELFQYEEILNMHPFERDAFFSLIIADAQKREQQARESRGVHMR